MLYSRNGNRPVKLPFRLKIKDGSVRTDVENQLTESELNEIGWYKTAIVDQIGEPQWYQDKIFDIPVFNEQTNIYTFTYIFVDKPLETVRVLKLKQLEEQKDTFLSNNFSEEDVTMKIVNLYKALGRLLEIIVNEVNIKTSVTNDQLLRNVYDLSTDLNNLVNNYKATRQSIINATTVAEIIAI